MTRHPVAESTLTDRLRTRRDLEEEDFLLDVGGEKEQVHDLSDPRAREAEGARHVGVVGKLAAGDAPLERV